MNYEPTTSAVCTNLFTSVTFNVTHIAFDDALDIKVGVGDFPTVWGNRMLLQRLFTNILNNAVKYNDKNEVIVNIGLRRVVKKR